MEGLIVDDELDDARQRGIINHMHAMKTKTSFGDVFKRIGTTSVVAFAALVFPSVLPWMIAFWIGCHTVLAKWKRPAWAPLAICLVLLIAKLVPRTPAMLTLGILLAVVVAIRFKYRKQPEAGPRWWIGAAVLWLAWGAVLIEWKAIESCGSPLAFDANRTVVCIGDSLTDGLLPDHGYPEQLKAMVSVPVVNLGFSGISAAQGLGQMNRVLAEEPQVVVIELGGHDFLRGHGRKATKQSLTEMIKACRAGGAEVVLMEIPRGFIFDPYASLEREIAYEQDVQLVADTWLRQVVIFGPAAPPGRWFPDLQLSDDGIHSNRKGSELIAKRVLTALKKMYGNQIVAAEPQVP